MIISVSGMVGSGKTTVAQRAADTLETTGRAALVLRFQSLPCFGLLRSSLAPVKIPAPAQSTAAGRDVRWMGYRPKRLGLATTVVYLVRMLAYRAYRLTLRGDRVHIMNRYFYDLFAHYRLDGAAERVYAGVLRAAMPVPDLAVLVVAREDTIAARRPDYSEEYLSALCQAYGRLRQRFPELVEVRTDPSMNDLGALDDVILAKAGWRDQASRL